jgi:membrane fusion protein (multidrug efflux system)
MNTLRVLLLAALIAGVFASCKHKQADEEQAGPATAPPVVSVKISPVQRGSLDDFISATGRIDVTRRQKVVSPVTGTLLSLQALEGVSVRSGQVLATIRPKEAQTAIAGAEVLLQGARTEAERREAEAAIRLASSTQNAISVRAGFNGVVATRSVTEGELVSENAELMTIVDLSTIVFIAEVPLRDAPKVRKGQRAMLDFQSLPHQRFPAVVDAVYPATEFQSQTVGVRLRLNNLGVGTREMLKPSMIGTSRMVTGTRKNVLIVPKSALLRDDEKNTFSVMIVTPDSVAKAIPVVVGVSTDSSAEVEGVGLAAGIPVIVEGNYALPDSARVRW